MTTQQMEYFLALAEKLNFSEVAERFFITQPTLSRQIGNMENELGAQLFVRKHNSVYLTPAGEMLYQGLKDIYGEFLGLTQQVEVLGQNRVGDLRIGLATDQQISQELLKAIRTYHALRPQVHINIFQCRYDQLRSGLLDGTLDLINGLYFPEATYSSGMTYRVLSHEPYCLAVCRQQAEKLPSQITRAELEALLPHVPLIMPDGEGFAPPTDNPVEDFRRDMKFSRPLTHVIKVKQLASLSLYVAAGLGVAVSNLTSIMAIDPNIRMIPISDGPTYSKIVAYRTPVQKPLIQDLENLINSD